MNYASPFDMPAQMPLEMQAQDLTKAPALGPTTDLPTNMLWRFATFVPAALGTALMMYGIYGWLAGGGMTGLEWVLLVMIGATFVWVTLSVSTVMVALAGMRGQRHPKSILSTNQIDVALLIPVFNETPEDVFGNAAAMLSDLATRKGGHHYTLFVLSDTSNLDVADREWRAFERLRHDAPPQIHVHYRRRSVNTDKKVGNLLDWVRGWGAAFEGMVVLDADSLMSGRAIERLATELAQDQSAGLIQTFPMLIGAQTTFARLQQFSNIAYGWLLAEGLALWARNEGNYWGHNAIIRTRAFAASAGLPHLRGLRGQQQLILSHDFVEAGLLRRAGWRVRFLPRVTGSFEETPATLIDYVIRDRRWCRGNLQHLRLLGTAGLHPVSRFHMLQGAAAYLVSPAWFGLLVIWSLLGKDADTNVIRYFNEANPLFPDWPPEMSHIDSALFLVIMYAMLLTPKLTSGGIILVTPKAVGRYGGAMAFLRSFAFELILSIAYAPILMIQQTKAVLRATFGFSQAWAPQARTARTFSWRELITFHWVETTLGILLFSGIAVGLISLWLLPIMTSLLLAVPLSALSGFDLANFRWRALRLESPHTLHEPSIVRKARLKRAELHAQIIEVTPAE